MPADFNACGRAAMAQLVKDQNDQKQNGAIDRTPELAWYQSMTLEGDGYDRLQV